MLSPAPYSRVFIPCLCLWDAARTALESGAADPLSPSSALSRDLFLPAQSVSVPVLQGQLSSTEALCLETRCLVELPAAFPRLMPWLVNSLPSPSQQNHAVTWTTYVLLARNTFFLARGRLVLAHCFLEEDISERSWEREVSSDTCFEPPSRHTTR